jgi:hypothetical protein
MAEDAFDGRRQPVVERLFRPRQRRSNDNWRMMRSVW